MEDIIWNCMIKRLAGEETEVSKAMLNAWLSADVNNLEKYNEVNQLWELVPLLPRDENKNPFQFNDLSVTEGESNKVRKLISNRFYKVGVAASIVAILLLGAYYFAEKRNYAPRERFLVKVAKAGQFIRFILPDSSKVWLNAGSEVKFSSQFTTSKTRKVYLKGEAYFEVRHDELHPFIVEGDKLTTTVHGTSFSVRSYPNELSSAVAVNSGKVGVSKTNIKNAGAIMLLPNDQLVYNTKQNSFSKSVIKNEDVDSWINGHLIFEQTSLAEVFETLSRRFKVQFMMNQEKYSGCKLTARFSPDQSLSSILKTLKILMNIKSKQIDQTIYVEGGDTCSNN